MKQQVSNEQRTLTEIRKKLMASFSSEKMTTYLGARYSMFRHLQRVEASELGLCYGQAHVISTSSYFFL